MDAQDVEKQRDAAILQRALDSFRGAEIALKIIIVQMNEKYGQDWLELCDGGK